MEPTSPLRTTPATPPHTVRWFLFASLVVVPALFFWTLLALVGLGIYGIIATLNDEVACTVSHVPLRGVLVTTSGGYATTFDQGYASAADDIVSQIQAADADDSIRAILLDVDSPGGTPVAGDEVARALSEASKPTVVVMRDIGASAAYWASAGADHIIASPVSDVGSIGVTMSYTEFAGANEEEGSRWVGIASGAYKDAGNPDRPLSDDEKAYFQGQVDAVHEYMVDRISFFRPTLPRERYVELADGRAYIGSEALTLGLIDALGGVDDALLYLESTQGLGEGGAVLCPLPDSVWDTLL